MSTTHTTRIGHRGRSYLDILRRSTRPMGVLEVAAQSGLTSGAMYYRYAPMHRLERRGLVQRLPGRRSHESVFRAVAA